MKNSALIFSLALTVILGVLGPQEAIAGPAKVHRARNILRHIARKEAQLNNIVLSLSAEEYAALVAAVAGSAPDTDGDGVADILEPANETDLCDEDSDDDGLDDGDEVEEEGEDDDINEVED